MLSDQRGGLVSWHSELCSEGARRRGASEPLRPLSSLVSAAGLARDSRLEGPRAARADNDIYTLSPSYNSLCMCVCVERVCGVVFLCTRALAPDDMPLHVWTVEPGRLRVRAARTISLLSRRCTPSPLAPRPLRSVHLKSAFSAVPPLTRACIGHVLHLCRRRMHGDGRAGSPPSRQ